MENLEGLTLAQMQKEFIEGSRDVEFTLEGRAAAHSFMEVVLRAQRYRTTDNALVEGKNGAVIRKHMGYGAIPGEHAEAIQKFYAAHFNPYLNYHRPCGFATIETGARGKRRRRYPVGDYCTRFEKLVSLEDWEQQLKEGISAPLLQQQATRSSDTEAALRMQKAKVILLAKCREADDGFPELCAEVISGRAAWRTHISMGASGGSRDCFGHDRAVLKTSWGRCGAIGFVARTDGCYGGVKAALLQWRRPW